MALVLMINGNNGLWEEESEKKHKIIPPKNILADTLAHINTCPYIHMQIHTLLLLLHKGFWTDKYVKWRPYSDIRMYVPVPIA